MGNINSEEGTLFVLLAILIHYTRKQKKKQSKKSTTFNIKQWFLIFYNMKFYILAPPIY